MPISGSQESHGELGGRSGAAPQRRPTCGAGSAWAPTNTARQRTGTALGRRGGARPAIGDPRGAKKTPFLHPFYPHNPPIHRTPTALPSHPIHRNGSSPNAHRHARDTQLGLADPSPPFARDAGTGEDKRLDEGRGEESGGSGWDVGRPWARGGDGCDVRSNMAGRGMVRDRDSAVTRVHDVPVGVAQGRGCGVVEVGRPTSEKEKWGEPQPHSSPAPTCHPKVTTSAGLRAATKTPRQDTTVRFCAFRTHLFCAPPLPLCYVPAAGIIAAGHAGCAGHAGGPHGCSGAAQPPPSTG